VGIYWGWEMPFTGFVTSTVRPGKAERGADIQIGHDVHSQAGVAHCSSTNWASIKKIRTIIDLCLQETLRLGDRFTILHTLDHISCIGLSMLNFLSITKCRAAKSMNGSSSVLLFSGFKGCRMIGFAKVRWENQ